MNTWHFWTNAADPLDDLPSIFTALDDFYDSIDEHLSAGLSATAEYKVYDLTDAEPRVPIDTHTNALTVSASSMLPNEVAVCLSYKAAPVSGQSAARLRGRIYIGPCGSSVLSNDTGGPVVSATASQDIADAAAALWQAGIGQSWYWVVFSPTQAGPSPWTSVELGVATNRAVEGFVDNAFDTIRSRGLSATERIIWD